METNQQKPLKLARRQGGMVQVHSIFPTIQGEGPFAGRSATFVRLYGCNLQCPGCDTDYMSVCKLGTPEEIVTQADVLLGNKLIVITGGEPFRQNIVPLVKQFIIHGCHVQIESNGVLSDDGFWDLCLMYPEDITVVVSPKTPRIHPKTARYANAYKYVLAWDSVAPDGLPEMALAHPLGGFTTVARPPMGWTGPVYLQPMDAKDEITNRRNVEAVVASVMKHKTWIMGMQLHKITNLP